MKQQFNKRILDEQVVDDEGGDGTVQAHPKGRVRADRENQEPVRADPSVENAAR